MERVIFNENTEGGWGGDFPGSKEWYSNHSPCLPTTVGGFPSRRSISSHNAKHIFFDTFARIGGGGCSLSESNEWLGSHSSCFSTTVHGFPHSGCLDSSEMPDRRFSSSSPLFQPISMVVMVAFDRVETGVCCVRDPSVEGGKGKDKSCGEMAVIQPSGVYQRALPLPLSHWPHFAVSGWSLVV